MYDTLEEALDGAYQAPDEIPEDEAERQQVVERFKIRDDNMANWAIRKIAAIRRQLAQDKAVADTERQRIDDWYEKRKAEAARREGFFTALLALYFRPQHDADPKHKKTFKLPAGSVQFKAQEPEYTKDDSVLLAWLKENAPDLVDVKESPKWGDLKSRCKVMNGAVVLEETGEVVPGVTAVERDKKVYVGVE